MRETGDGFASRILSFWSAMRKYLEQEMLNDSPAGKGEYWEEFWLLFDKNPMNMRTEYMDVEFCEALEQYRNQSIQESIGSENPLVRMFAVLDGRVGKRMLEC